MMIDLDLDGLASLGSPTLERVAIDDERGVWLRSPASARKDRWQSWMYSQSEEERETNWRAKTIVLCLCDATGKHLVAPNPAAWEAAAERLGGENGIPPPIMERIYRRAAVLAGIGSAAVEAAEKN